MKWEYKAALWSSVTERGIGSDPAERTERNLNAIGVDGWELASAIEHVGGAPDGTSQTTLVFKRPSLARGV